MPYHGCCLTLLQQGVMNGRRPAAALRELQQQERQQLGMHPRTAVAVADAAEDDDSSSVSSMDGTPQPLLHTLQEVSGPAGAVANGEAAAGAANGAVSVRSTSGSGRASDGDGSDESLDGSRTTSVQPSVAPVADEVSQARRGTTHSTSQFDGNMPGELLLLLLWLWDKAAQRLCLCKGLLERGTPYPERMRGACFPIAAVSGSIPCVIAHIPCILNLPQ